MNSPNLSVAEELSAARKLYREGRIPHTILYVMDEAVAALKASGLADRVAKIGQPVEDFMLPDAKGTCVRLINLLVAGPVVLVFYRGGWCPYCNLHLRGLQRIVPELRAAGASLVAISPQLPDGSLSTQEANDLAFKVLSDVGNHVARRFGLVYTLPPELLEIYARFGNELSVINGPDGGTELPVPAAFVIAADLKIRYAHGDVDYTYRADPEEILWAVKNIV